MLVTMGAIPLPCALFSSLLSPFSLLVSSPLLFSIPLLCPLFSLILSSLPFSPSPLHFLLSSLFSALLIHSLSTLLPLPFRLLPFPLPSPPSFLHVNKYLCIISWRKLRNSSTRFSPPYFVREIVREVFVCVCLCLRRSRMTFTKRETTGALYVRRKCSHRDVKEMHTHGHTNATSTTTSLRLYLEHTLTARCCGAIE